MQRQRDLAIIIPAWNAAEFLGQTLASIAANGHWPREIFVVDDASFDGTAQVCVAWASILPVEFIQLDVNGGVSAARNTGLQRATSRFVTFLDADDLLGPDHIRLVCDVAEQGDAIVSPTAWYWHPDGSTTDYSSRLRRQHVPKHGQLASLADRNYVFIAAVAPTELVRKVEGFRGFPLDQTGSPKPGERGLCEDWDMWLRLVATGLQVKVVQQHSVWYRVRSGSLNEDEAGMYSAGVRMLDVFATEHPGQANITVRPMRRLKRRVGVAELQSELSREGRRASLKEVVQRVPGSDSRSIIRLIALFVLSPTQSARLFGRRGAW